MRSPPGLKLPCHANVGMASGRGLQAWPGQVCSALSLFPNSGHLVTGIVLEALRLFKKNLVSWMTFVLSAAQGTVLVISLICIEWAQALPERVTLEKALWHPDQGAEEEPTAQRAGSSSRDRWVNTARESLVGGRR